MAWSDLQFHLTATWNNVNKHQKDSVINFPPFWKLDVESEDKVNGCNFLCFYFLLPDPNNNLSKW